VGNRCWITWKLDTGYWILDTGCWILDSRYWILDVGFKSIYLKKDSSLINHLSVNSFTQILCGEKIREFVVTISPFGGQRGLKIPISHKPDSVIPKFGTVIIYLAASLLIQSCCLPFNASVA